MRSIFFFSILMLTVHNTIAQPAGTKLPDSLLKAKETLPFMSNANVNDAELFKHSAAYREWLTGYITKLAQTRYKHYIALEPGCNDIAKLKAVSNEIKDPFIKEYYLYTLAGTIIRSDSVRNPNEKEDAYRKFMAVAMNPLYKTDLLEVYNSYRNKLANAMAPESEFQSVDNKKISLKELRGKYIYINIWATWCAPCKAELPFLKKMRENYAGRDIYFMSLSIDRVADKRKWQSYVKDNELKGIQVSAEGASGADFIKSFNVVTIPRFILIDPAGKIITREAKNPSDPYLKKQLNELLKMHE